MFLNEDARICYMIAANWKLSITKTGEKPNFRFSHIAISHILSGMEIKFEAIFTLYTATAL